MSLDAAAAYDEHVWDVYAYLAYRLGTREDAEDLTQQTFERALRHRGTYDPERASARTWLLTIAHNLLIDHYRRQHPTVELAALDDDEIGFAAPLAPNIGLEPDLAAALALLGTREREIVALRFGGGDMTGPEIAALLGLTLANVQQILSRALRRMRAALGAELGEPAPRPTAQA